MRSQERTSTAPVAAQRKTRSRLTAVGAAVLAALAVWAAFEPLGGVELRAPAGGAGRTHDVGPLTVLMPSLLASLAGWGLLAVLERFVRRARTVWTVVAVVVLALSLGGPLSATGISALNQAALAAMHVAVAAALIPLLVRTSDRA